MILANCVHCVYNRPILLVVQICSILLTKWSSIVWWQLAKLSLLRRPAPALYAM
jgi:hypothetical protein